MSFGVCHALPQSLRDVPPKPTRTSQMYHLVGALRQRFRRPPLRTARRRPVRIRRGALAPVDPPVHPRPVVRQLPDHLDQLLKILVQVPRIVCEILPRQLPLQLLLVAGERIRPPGSRSRRFCRSRRT